MAKWIALHTDVYIAGTDGFKFVLLRRPYASFMDNPSIEECEFIKQCLPNNKRAFDAFGAMRRYLAESGGTHAIANHYTHNSGLYFLIGFRKETDLFKFKLKFPDTLSLTVWEANTKFFVRVAEGDEFIRSKVASGDRRTFSDEGW